MRPLVRRLFAAAFVTFSPLALVIALAGENLDFLPSGTRFENPSGALTVDGPAGGIDLTGPFFQSLGTNGRSCSTCHQPGDGMSVSATHIQERFERSAGLDPIFRTVDGSNCNHDVDVSTHAGRRAAYKLLRTRGLIRIGIQVPAAADFAVVNVDNPYHCSETDTISMYRRPLPAVNLRFLTTVMWDGRESSPLTGTTPILFANYPASLLNDLAHQSVDATTGHAQGDGTHPTALEQQQIVDFEMGLYAAQFTVHGAGRLDERGAAGGPSALIVQPFFPSINSSVNVLLPRLEQPGGLATPGDGQFTPAVFNLFNAWADVDEDDARAAILRGQALFASKPISISGVRGINDDVTAGGLVAGGLPVLRGTCGTCHDTPNAGNHSFATPLNIGAGDPDPANPSVSLGGLDISYLPRVTVCKKDATGHATGTCATTTDLGQALIDGRFDHVGKLKGPILRGLSARAPYFHNGSARTLLDVVRFYETRFGLSFTPRDEADLVMFLSAL